MDETRQKLINAGWRQGVILAPSGVLADRGDCIGFLVLTQTCDCINPSFEKEPHLELLPLKEISGKANRQFANARNPRQIQFQIEEKGEKKWVEAKISEIFNFDRRDHEKLTIASQFSMTSLNLDDLVAWRAARYLRTAFPDKFVQAFSSLSKPFSKKIKKHENLIDSLLISFEPFEEIDEDDFYELQVSLLVDPLVMGVPENASILKDLSIELKEILTASPHFHEPQCAVISLKEMSLYERRQHLDFTDYDYLSFGVD